jgi:uncharacterized protein (TIGR03118 family)
MKTKFNTKYIILAISFLLASCKEADELKNNITQKIEQQKQSISEQIINDVLPILDTEQSNQNSKSNYAVEVLVSNDASQSPQILEPKLKNAWGIAIRPAGAGGHFWVTGKNISFEYVGDVKSSNDLKLQKLYTDELKYMDIDIDKNANSTGTAFNGGKNFTITQNPNANSENQQPITAAAKFVFIADDGSLHAWTERKNYNIDGSLRSTDWPTSSIKILQEADASFFGLSFNKDFSRLYIADFGADPQIRSYNKDYTPTPDLKFDQPFDSNNNKKVDAGEYAPFNIQYLQDKDKKGHLLVAYAQTSTDKKGKLIAGEEKAGSGRLAEFDENGKLIRIFDHQGLDAPWGMAYAPNNYGKYSGHLLVANFGSGLISAYNPSTLKFAGFLQNNEQLGQNIKINGIWGLQFGNGVSLGDSNALYFSAGPNDEKNGIFGSIRHQSF